MGRIYKLTESQLRLITNTMINEAATGLEPVPDSRAKTSIVYFHDFRSLAGDG